MQGNARFNVRCEPLEFHVQAEKGAATALEDTKGALNTGSRRLLARVPAAPIGAQLSGSTTLVVVIAREKVTFKGKRAIANQKRLDAHLQREKRRKQEGSARQLARLDSLPAQSHRAAAQASALKRDQERQKTAEEQNEVSFGQITHRAGIEDVLSGREERICSQKLRESAISPSTRVVRLARPPVTAVGDLEVGVTHRLQAHGGEEPHQCRTHV